MISITKEREIILKKPIQVKLHYLRFVLPFLAMMVLVACGDRNLAYKGTCAQQTQQFMDYVHSLVIDDLTPVMRDGFKSGQTAEAIKKLEKLDAEASKLKTPECNPRTPAVKDALRQYMLEVKNYFSVVAGRAIYGEGAVQGQLSKMNEAGLAFEVVLEDLRK